MGVVAGCFMPDSDEERAVLKTVVRPIREAGTRRQGRRGVFDAGRLTEGDLTNLADAIRSHNEWLCDHIGSPLTAEDMRDYREVLSGFATWVREMGPRLRGPAALDLRPAFAAERLEASSDADVACLAHWFHRASPAATRLRDRRTLPRMTATIDRRPGLESADVLELLGRLTVYTTYLEVYRLRLGEMVGVSPTPGFRVRSSGDEVSDGLVVADVMATGAGLVACGQDHDGKAARFLARARWDYEPASSAPRG
jgi:hypothetical protein